MKSTHIFNIFIVVIKNYDKTKQMSSESETIEFGDYNPRNLFFMKEVANIACEIRYAREYEEAITAMEALIELFYKITERKQEAILS